MTFEYLFLLIVLILIVVLVAFLSLLMVKAIELLLDALILLKAKIKNSRKR